MDALPVAARADVCEPQKKRSRGKKVLQEVDPLASDNTKPAEDPVLAKLIDVALHKARGLERFIHSQEEEEGRKKLLESVKAASFQDFRAPLPRLCNVEMLELPNYYIPWLDPVTPARSVDGDPIPEFDYVKRTYVAGKQIVAFDDLFQSSYLLSLRVAARMHIIKG